MSVFSKLFGKQSSSLPQAHNTSQDWRNFRHRKGLFSVRLPSDWQEISPLSADAAFAAAAPTKRVLLEIFCGESNAGPGKTGFAAVADLSHAMVGLLRAKHPDVREVWQGSGGTSYDAVCRRLIIEYTERYASADKFRSGLFTIDYFLIGTENRFFFVNFKLLSSEYPAWANIFERIASGISIPHVSQIRIVPRDSLQAGASLRCGRKRAQALEKEGKREEALEVFSQAIREDPNNSAAHIDRGLLLSELGRYGESVADYTRALEIYPSHAVTYNNRAIAYFKLGEQKKALDDLSHALRLDPGNKYFLDNHRNIQSLIEKGERHQPKVAASQGEPVVQSTDEAGPGGFLSQLSQEQRSAVSNHDPGFYEMIMAAKVGGYTDLNFINVGTSSNMEIAGKLLWELSDAELKRLAESVRYTIRADAAVQSDQEEAARLYRKAFELNPYDDIPIMSYGVLLAQQGDLREGIKWLERAVEVNPKSERARQNLKTVKSML
jgi:tetratricopeptide (TPR) repeat protein